MLSILSIVLNAVYTAVMFIDIYTDRFYLPGDNGEPVQRVIKRSPASRLGVMDKSWLVILMIAVAVISVVLAIIGLRNKKLRPVVIGSMILSTVIFITVMIITAHPTYTY